VIFILGSKVIETNIRFQDKEYLYLVSGSKNKDACYKYNRFYSLDTYSSWQIYRPIDNSTLVLVPIDLIAKLTFLLAFAY
jgi:hypothetical protein